MTLSANSTTEKEKSDDLCYFLTDRTESLTVFEKLNKHEDKKKKPISKVE